jgi:hypothetical protein
MPRDPKLDKAKRQAMGVFKAVPRFATRAEGDFRPTESAKSFYTQPRVESPSCDGVKVKYCATGKMSGGKYAPRVTIQKVRSGFSSRSEIKAYDLNAKRRTPDGLHSHAQLPVLHREFIIARLGESRLIPARAK